MKKNIWIFHHYADPPDGYWTGTYDLYKFLVRKGHRVTVVSSSFNHYSRREERLAPGENVCEKDFGGMKFVFVRTPCYDQNNWRRAWNMMMYGIRAYQWGRSQCALPDVIIASTPHPFCVFAASLLAEKFDVPFLMELHDLWLDYLLDTKMSSSWSPHYRLLKWMEIRCYHRAKKILVLWPRMNLYLHQFGIPDEKIVWTPLGIDFSSFTPPPAKVLSNGDPFVVTCTARFGPASNLNEILEAAALLKKKGDNRFRFVLIGGGPEKENLEKYARDHQLSNMEFRGMVPKGDIPKHLQESDACIAGLPDIPNYRKYGTIPTKVIDYLTANRPTVFITSIKNSVVEIAKAGYIVPPARPEVLAKTLETLISLSPQQRAQLGQNGLDYVREHHNLEKLADKVESLL